MLFGTAPLAPVAARAPKMERLDAGPLVLPGVHVLRATYEIARRDVETFFPPALQATIPPLLSWTFHLCTEGPLGPFCMADARLHCRSGARTRTYLLGSVIDSSTAGDALTGGWGFGARTGDPRLERCYDRIEGSVKIGNRTILEISMLDPIRLGSEDVHFAPSMHAAHTPEGLRLLQVDARYVVERNERGRPRIHGFSAEDWLEERLRPLHPVSATFSIANLTLGKPRFMSRPDVNAFEGTESIG